VKARPRRKRARAVLHCIRCKCEAARGAGQTHGAPACQRLAPQMTMGHADGDAPASSNWRADLPAKSVQRLNNRQAFPPLSCLLGAVTALDFLCPIRFNRSRTAHVPREKPMKKLVLAILLISSPAWAQTKLVPKSVTARADNCAPIGRTADGKLVYSMKCENLPAPPPPPQAEVAPSPPPEPEVRRTGIFGLSFERKRPDE
jgi:hypothetical protein